MRVRRFVIQQRSIGDRNNSRGAVDCESTTSIVGQAVSDGVGGCIRIGRERGDSHDRAICRILGNAVNRDVVVDRSRDRRFIHIGDGDCEKLIGMRRVGGCRSHGNTASCPIGFSIDGSSNCDDARIRIDRKTPAIIVDQRVRDRVRRAVRVHS